jgi:hypothetical protein
MPVRVPRILSAVKEGRGTRVQNVNSHSRGAVPQGSSQILWHSRPRLCHFGVAHLSTESAALPDRRLTSLGVVRC